MRVLTIRFDVSALSDAQIESLEYAAIVQAEDVYAKDEDGAEIGDPIDAVVLAHGIECPHCGQIRTLSPEGKEECGGIDQGICEGYAAEIDGAT